MSKWNAGARDGGANQKKTVMPPVSEDYRNNFDAIFRKKSTTSREDEGEESPVSGSLR